MIREEYKRLLELLDKSSRLEVELEEVLQEVVVFFETLRKEFPKSDEDGRAGMIEMMNNLHAKLKEVAKSSAQKAGMSEEELGIFAEDPKNFTPEQWRAVTETRSKLYDSARKFSATMEKEKGKSQDPDTKKPKARPIRSKTRRPKRKDWTKS